MPEKKSSNIRAKISNCSRVDNEFSRNKNSVYEILESNEQLKINNKSNQSSSNKDIPNSVSENTNSSKDQIFKLQFASFRDKKKV